MSNYQPQPQMQPPVYGANPYQVMDNPNQYAQYNQWSVPVQTAPAPQAPASESFLDKFINWVIGFIAKLSWQPDPKTWAWKPVWIPTQPVPGQYQQVPQQMQQPQYQQPVPQSGWIIWGFVQWVQQVGNIWGQIIDGWKDIYQWAKWVVQQVADIPQNMQQNAQQQEAPVMMQQGPMPAQQMQQPVVQQPTPVQEQPTAPQMQMPVDTQFVVTTPPMPPQPTA